MYFEGFDSSQKFGASRLKLQQREEMLNNYEHATIDAETMVVC